MDEVAITGRCTDARAVDTTDSVLYRSDAWCREACQKRRAHALQALISDLSRRGLNDVVFQRAAFDAVASLIGAAISPQEAVERRREARLATGLSLLADSHSRIAFPLTHHPPAEEALLDTEVIAIYW